MWCDWQTMGFFGWTMMILLWGAVFALVIWGLRSSTGSSTPSRSDALEVLARRFAAGEIDKDEFEERKRVLEDSRRR